MTDEKPRRRVAIKTFTCPNHPDGPPRLPAEGYEREELTLAEAYTPEEVICLVAVVKAARPEVGYAADVVEKMLGTCCIGHKWRVTAAGESRKAVYRTTIPC